MNLKRTLESSIARAEEEITYCREELEGKREISNLHRNSFHHIAGPNGNFSFYFDDEDIEYQRLREVAKNIVDERARDYDLICRKYLDVEKMIETRLPSLRHLNEGGLINGADVLNYAISLLKDGSSEGFDAYFKIGDKSHNSDFRRVSVQSEMKVFEDYIALCQKKLEAL